MLAFFLILLTFSLLGCVQVIQSQEQNNKEERPKAENYAIKFRTQYSKTWHTVEGFASLSDVEKYLNWEQHFETLVLSSEDMNKRKKKVIAD